MTHPMIQPVSWGVDAHPGRVALNWPKERAELYKVVWGSSMACAMRPPLLRHVRAVWECAGVGKVAAAQLTAEVGREGYWLERSDYPGVSWPVNAMSHRIGEWGFSSLSSARIESVSLVAPLASGGLTLGVMIQGIFDAGLTTPASISGLVADLLGRGRPSEAGGARVNRAVAFVETKDVGVDGRRHVVLTAEGAARLDRWRSADLVGRVGSRNSVVDLVERGELSPRDGLRELVGEHPVLRAIGDCVARQIDAMSLQWAGMGRAEGLLEQAKLSHRPGQRNALPSWMDPEFSLPADHALRRWRERMEAELALADPTWALLGEQVRAQKRFEWLMAHQQQIAQDGGAQEFASAMDPYVGKFSAVRYWLTGLERT